MVTHIRCFEIGSRHRFIWFSKWAFPLAEITGQPSRILLPRTKKIEYPAYSRTNCELKCVNISLQLFLCRQLSRVYFVLCVRRLKRPYILCRLMYREHARNWSRLMLSRVAHSTAQIKLQPLVCVEAIRGTVVSGFPSYYFTLYSPFLFLFLFPL